MICTLQMSCNPVESSPGWVFQHKLTDILIFCTRFPLKSTRFLLPRRSVSDSLCI